MQVVNEQGKIKCIDEKGNVKWFSRYMVEQSSVLKDYNITVVNAPEPMLPKIEAQVPNEPVILTLEGCTKAQLIEKLQGVDGWKVTDSKETLFNLYINQNK